MRLDVALVHRRRLEAAFDDNISLGKASFDVAELVLELARNVRRRVRCVAGCANVVMQDGGAGLHRLIDVDDPWQHLVVDLDQIECSLRNLLGRRGNGGNGMTGKQDFAARHHVAAEPAHVGDADQHRLVERNLGHVRRSDHRLDAGQRGGFRGIDRFDAGMRMRAAQHFAPDHAWLSVIGTVERAPRDLVLAVRPGGALADPLVVGIVARHVARPVPFTDRKPIAIIRTSVADTHRA